MPSYFSSSSSQRFYSSTTKDGQTETHSYAEQVQTNPDGTTVRTAYKDNGRPLQYSQKHYPTIGQPGASSGQDTSRRIEDVSEQETDRRYKEAIENEYAKREGGA